MRPRFRMMVGALLIGLLFGVMLILGDQLLGTTAALRERAIEVEIIDDSGANAPRVPPTLTLAVGEERLVFEQHATSGALETGLFWQEGTPLVMTYSSGEPATGPDLHITLDMAESLQRALEGAPDRRGSQLPLLVVVTTGPADTTVRVELAGTLLVDESLPRPDWRSDREAALRACVTDAEVELGPTLAPTLAAFAALSQHIGTLYRPLSDAQWVRETDEAIRLVGGISDALDDASGTIGDLAPARAWQEQVDEVLRAFVRDLEEFRSAAVEGSPERMPDTFRQMERTFQLEVEPLQDALDLELWCAAGPATT